MKVRLAINCSSKYMMQSRSCFSRSQPKMYFLANIENLSIFDHNPCLLDGNNTFREYQDRYLETTDDPGWIRSSNIFK